MKKEWKDIRVGDRFKDGSIVTQIHRTHKEECCKVIYDNTKEISCSYTHIFLIDVSELNDEAKKELSNTCTFVPLEEEYHIESDIPLSNIEAMYVEQFCHNEYIDIEVKYIEDKSTLDLIEVYQFMFDTPKIITIRAVPTKTEPQKVDNNTYWLTCRGIDYLMKKYKGNLYSNGLIINSIESIGHKDCFCISTNTGRYEL